MPFTHLRKIAYLILLCTAIPAFGQVKLKRSTNSTLLNYANTHPEWNSNTKLYKWNRKDTLKIPFFDDFVSTIVYPDSSKWFDNNVFINNDFAVLPPSYGVATFDNLDKKGHPYTELNDLNFGPCDTLTSLLINLNDSSGKFYSPADSIYFSFYFQRQGLGDPSDQNDSLVLQFKDTSGLWITQFLAKGGLLSPFEYVMVGLQNTAFFHKGFQFRFINYGRQTGNMNQWHVDYVHLARNRKISLRYYDDIAIQSRPSSLLKNYFQMPYAHFLVDSANQKSKLLTLSASNLHNVTKNVQARHTESNGSNVLIATNYNSNNANIPAQDSAKRRFNGFNLGGLSGSPVVIKREYEIRESGIASKYATNDKITVYQEFGSCYAYDDGTAEYGFGYDDDVPDQFYKGAVAYRFNLTQSDSLWAIGMFFNRSVKNSATWKFDLKVWQKISAPGTGRGGDVSLHSDSNLSPVFTDSLNGYFVFVFDKAVMMPKGEFFIGWEQEGNFHLDVGWDHNNGYNTSKISNNLFYLNVLGNWQAIPTSLTGALMMRPYVGKKVKLGPANLSAPENSHNVLAYPNPFRDKISLENSSEIVSMELYNLSGQKLLESHSNTINTSELPTGVYLLNTITKSGKNYRQKIIKLQD